MTGVLMCDVIAELFMIQDSSVDFGDTWSFMDRRLADVRDVGHLTQQVGGETCLLFIAASGTDITVLAYVHTHTHTHTLCMSNAPAGG